MAELTGANLIGGRESLAGEDGFYSARPATGERGAVRFRDATAAEVKEAVDGALMAFQESRAYPASRRAEVLRSVAAEIEALGDQLIETADLETDLGLERLRSERARTCGQLRAFADLVEEGWYLEATIDTADPGGGRPDLRRMLIPIGPVAVFPASNFPFAFGVAGGDTASALAAGCPVVVKAHPLDPETSELFGRAINRAIALAGLNPGLFSLLQGAGNAVGETLVMAPGIKAVGFTGSLRGGRALYDLAGRREEPIPVYAEMGSLNPVFVTEGALHARGEAIAQGLVGSLLQGRGQFCTKPGLVFIPDGQAGDRFASEIGSLASRAERGPLLSPRMADALAVQVSADSIRAGVSVLAGGREMRAEIPQPTVVSVDAETYRGSKPLHEEHFGPFAVLVRTRSLAEMETLAEELPGNLTATVHAEPSEGDEVAPLVGTLQQKVGRLIWNGYPTGVAVTHAMQHGGPYPATTTPATTSVGTAAIKRFLRPVTYQNYPGALLPEALRDANPLGILRLLNGRWTTAPVGA